MSVKAGKSADSKVLSEDLIRSALNTARKHRAAGGGFSTPHIHKPKMAQPKKATGPKLHTGPIHSHVAGRTDHLPMHVPNGAYVIPADIISGMGEGNTMAGFKVAKSLFSAPFYGSGAPYGASGLPYGMPSPHKAGGGEVDSGIPIIAAGGEFVISPQDVMRVGNGNLDDGHKILDEFVNQSRAKLVKTLQKLPGPKKN